LRERRGRVGGDREVIRGWEFRMRDFNYRYYY
jgi:hypothetical protein